MERKTKLSKVTAQALSTPEAQILFDDLKVAGYGVHVSKKDYAEIVGCSTSCIDNYLAKGSGIPSYKKIGKAKNSRVLFSLRDVAEYLAAQTVQTA